jgi:hypothetical protein
MNWNGFVNKLSCPNWGVIPIFLGVTRKSSQNLSLLIRSSGRNSENPPRNPKTLLFEVAHLLTGTIGWRGICAALSFMAFTQHTSKAKFFVPKTIGQKIIRPRIIPQPRTAHCDYIGETRQQTIMFNKSTNKRNQQNNSWAVPNPHMFRHRCSIVREVFLITNERKPNALPYVPRFTCWAYIPVF